MADQSSSAHEDVRKYYGETLKSSSDLQTSCCTSAALPPEFREILKQIDPEILDRFYGCGSPLPECLAGLTVLDLGCGTGRDCYLLSKLVGPCGRVIGVDMTDEQLDVARRHIGSMTERYGYDSPNVDFRKARIEDLQAAGIEDDSVDLVVSNCVLNLSPDKDGVFREIFRVLKPGGELYFSDVYCDRRIPVSLQRDPVFRGECLGGALYFEDFRRLLALHGCRDYRVLSNDRIAINNPDIEAQAGCLQFYSMTVRAFKLASLEESQESYGHIATYLGSVPGRRKGFVLDENHVFEAGRPALVSGNTAAMLSETRYAKHFEVIGDRSCHYGAFLAEPAALDPELCRPGHSAPSGSSCC